MSFGKFWFSRVFKTKERLIYCERRTWELWTVNTKEIRTSDETWYSLYIGSMNFHLYCNFGDKI